MDLEGLDKMYTFYENRWATSYFMLSAMGKSQIVVRNEAG